jgi:hypothetical protein
VRVLGKSYASVVEVDQSLGSVLENVGGQYASSSCMDGMACDATQDPAESDWRVVSRAGG